VEPRERDTDPTAPPGGPDLPVATASEHRSALPGSPNRIIGRGREVGALSERLRAGSLRFLTLTGPGGVGKTRLAIEVAAAPAPRYGAVWFVELAPVLAGSDVAASVARALQLAESPGHETDLMCDYLSRRQGLLLLDTCEHVV
jgi:hypothetical protein